ncbi:MAG: hypothetical protein DWI22_19095 [Planctomycetota bacterium]|nr:MAG: hypothetical protein DWI22_19095 [Planctomycetota bacterium]
MPVIVFSPGSLSTLDSGKLSSQSLISGGDQPAQRHAKKRGSDTMKTIAAGLMNVVLSHHRQCFQPGRKNWQPSTIAAREKSSSLKMDCL